MGRTDSKSYNSFTKLQQMKTLILLLFPLFITAQDVVFDTQILYNKVTDKWTVMHERWTGEFATDPRLGPTDIKINTPLSVSFDFPANQRESIQHQNDGESGFEISKVPTSKAVLMLYWFKGGYHFYSLSTDGTTLLFLCSDCTGDSIPLAKSVRKQLMKYN